MTSDHREALSLLDDARAKALRIFKGEDTHHSSDIAPVIRPTFIPPVLATGEGVPKLQIDQAAKLARAFFADAIREMDADPFIAQHVQPEETVRLRAEFEDSFTEAKRCRPLPASAPATGVEISILKKAGLKYDPQSEAFLLFREYLRRAAIEISRIGLARFDGDFSVISEDAFFSVGEIQQIADAGLNCITIEAAQRSYFSRISGGNTTAKTKDRYRNELRHIVAFFGASIPMSSINGQACEDFLNIFSKLPPNFQTRIEKGACYRQIATDYKVGDEKLAWATLNKYLAMLSRFCDWAAKYDYIAKNYASDLKPFDKKPDSSIAKLPFENDELARIFARPIYCGCRDDGMGFAKTGPNIIRRARYWAPLIALFAGLRCGEIMQLTPNHVRVSPSGNPYIVLTKDMQLKNRSAEREIPLHSILVEAGFIDWVNRRRSRPDERLFLDVAPDKNYDQPSSTFSKRFASDLKYFGLGERRNKLTFHSFRHTFKRALDRADVREDKKDELCGWSRTKKQGRSYGAGLEADVLKSSVDLVHFDIDLNHLRSHAILND